MVPGCNPIARPSTTAALRAASAQGEDTTILILSGALRRSASSKDARDEDKGQGKRGYFSLTKSGYDPRNCRHRRVSHEAVHA